MEEGLLEQLLRLQLLAPNDLVATVRGMRAAAATATHAVSFGPGRGLARLAHALAVGSGLQLVDAALPTRREPAYVLAYRKVVGEHRARSRPTISSPRRGGGRRGAVAGQIWRLGWRRWR